MRQVVPGSSVSIVLKADQRTGREVQGIVQDLLTRGDHPRGIKVRLQDGRVGRVQRMTGSNALVDTAAIGNAESFQDEPELSPRPEFRMVFKEPKRSGTKTLSEPSSENVANRCTSVEAPLLVGSAIVVCPICSNFEGDEAAVSYHVERHLSGEIEGPD